MAFPGKNIGVGSHFLLQTQYTTFHYICHIDDDIYIYIYIFFFFFPFLSLWNIPEKVGAMLVFHHCIPMSNKVPGT